MFLLVGSSPMVFAASTMSVGLNIKESVSVSQLTPRTLVFPAESVLARTPSAGRERPSLART